MKPRILDLCSGLGGASEAFVQAGCEVVRIENNELLAYVPFTAILDVKEWMEWLPELGRFDVVIAAPPCLAFSDGYHAPKSRYVRANGGVEGYEPDLSILQAVLDIEDYLKPTWFILENVRGAGPYFRELVGTPRQSIGPFFLWGRFPHIVVEHFDHSKTSKTGSQDRAKWPFELSWALLKACRSQWTLRAWQ